MVLDFDELGEVEYEETKFVTGVALESLSPQYAKVFESEELLSQYIRVYSAQATYAADGVIGEAINTNERDLEMGCNFEENGLNYTKFIRPKRFTSRFCIDPEAEYKL